ncbi:hypothetical protein [Massilia sp. S19_KUP03_FR1]|uniref:hypothetical protein n=1 Tax=Massilia sp. S19_KUP03_FR1 TaxID=3025503 RepID=UPI002FCDD0E6
MFFAEVAAAIVAGDGDDKLLTFIVSKRVVGDAAFGTRAHLGAVQSLRSQNDCEAAVSCMGALASVEDSGIVGDLSEGFVFVTLIS